MAAKKVKTILKINLPAGEATPAPPVGTALGQHGVQIMDFVKAYNDKTSKLKGQMIPAVITIYEDRSFNFELKKAPVAEFIRRELNIKKGSGEPNQKFVGELTDSQLTKIAEEKMDDLNTKNLESAKKIVAGTARSMGVKTKQ